MIGLLILGPMFSAVAVLAMDMVWISAFAASATACAIYSLVFVCLLAILLLCLTGFCVLLSCLPL